MVVPAVQSRRLVVQVVAVLSVGSCTGRTDFAAITGTSELPGDPLTSMDEGGGPYADLARGEPAADGPRGDGPTGGDGDTAAADTPSADDGPGVTTVTVNPSYPMAGAQWNDYIANGDPPAGWYGQVDASCELVGRGSGQICLHGGELRTVELPALQDCSGVIATDALGAFTWRCDASSTPVVVHSTGLRRGLRDLVDASGWRPNRVEIRVGSVLRYESVPGAWWSNPIVALPENLGTGAVALDSPGASGTIYVAATPTLSNGYHIVADKTALVVLDGAEVRYGGYAGSTCNSANGESDGANDARCLVNAGTHNYLWLEGRMRGDGAATRPNTIILWSQVHSSTLRAVAATGSAGDGIYLLASDNNRLVELDLADHMAAGIVLYAASGNVLHTLRSFGNWGSGVVLAASTSSNNTLTNVVATANAGDAGLDFHRCVGNTAAHVTAANNVGRGVYLMSYGTYYAHTLAQALLVNNGAGGLEVSASECVVANASALANAGFSYAVTDPADRVTFAGYMVQESGAVCAETSTGVTPGLIDVSCTDSGASGSSTFTGQLSTATLWTDGSTSQTVWGKVVVDDSVNTSDVAGARLNTEISDWFGGESWYRSWGKDGPAFPAALQRGRCSGELCRLWDWRLPAASGEPLGTSGDGHTANQAFVGGAACPTAVDGQRVLTDTQTPPNTFLLNARELFFDGVGDDDGLCESLEDCSYSPNLGAYQGHGTLDPSPCLFQDGAVQGVRIFAFVENGI